MQKILLFIGFLLIVISAVLFGSFNLFGNNQTELNLAQRWQLIYELRLPRILTALLAGAILSCCGLLTQTLLKNPLACPYTLGISQVVALILFSVAFLNINFFILILVLAVLICSLCLLLNKNHYYDSEIWTVKIILIGLALGSFCSSLILALQFSLDGMSIIQISRWLMGSLNISDYSGIPILIFVAVLITFVIQLNSRNLDWLLLGEEIAVSRGVDIKKTGIILHLVVLLSVAVIVWNAGPIGFVGLIVPHAVRFLGIKGHAWQSLYCAFIGAAFLCFCDLLSRTIIAPIEIPIGVVTGLIGAPCFVFLLLRQRG